MLQRQRGAKARHRVQLHAAVADQRAGLQRRVVSGQPQRAAADADVQHAQGERHVGHRGVAKARRGRVALGHVHPKGAAALEAVDHAGQRALQGGGLRAAHEQETLDVELQLDAVHVGHGHGLVGLDQAVQRGQARRGAEVQRALCPVQRPQRGGEHAAVGAVEVDRRLPVAQLPQQRQAFLRVGDAEGGPGIVAARGVEFRWVGVLKHRCAHAACRVSARSCGGRPACRPGPAARARPGGGSRRR